MKLAFIKALIIFSVSAPLLAQETDLVSSENRLEDRNFLLFQSLNKDLNELHKEAVNVRRFFNKILLTGDNELIPELRSMHEAAFDKANLLPAKFVSLKVAGFSIEEPLNKYNKIVQLLNVGEDAAMIQKSQQSLERPPIDSQSSF